MKSYKSGPAVQGAIRAMDRMNRLLDQGNFRGALGFKTSVFPENGYGLPRPTRWTKQGRLWSFGG